MKSLTVLTNTQAASNNFFWGAMLWFFGYVLGFVFYAFVPKQYIGLFIMPFGVAAALWVLFARVRRERFKSYVWIAVFWTALAIVLDYLFIVLLLHATDYYKPDVYLYYVLTFSLPIAVGWYRVKKRHRSDPST